MEIKWNPLPHSTHSHEGVFAGYPSAEYTAELFITLRKPQELHDFHAKADALILQKPWERKHFTHQELAGITGAVSEDASALETWFSSCGLKFTQVSKLTRRYSVKGTIAAFEKAFNIRVSVYETHGGRKFLAHSGFMMLPSDLQKCVRHITGFSPALKKARRIHPVRPQEDSASATGLSVPQIVKAYNFPGVQQGSSVTIGLIELGGKYNPQDIQTFYKNNGLPPAKLIEVGTPPPNTDVFNDDVEVTLDIEVAGGAAAQQKGSKGTTTLVVYYAATIMQGLQMAIGDETNKPDVLSISWATSENYTSQAEYEETEWLLYQAATLGITVCVCSGDYGAYNQQQTLQVMFPASSPYVLGVGGTELTLDSDGCIQTEVVWNDTYGASGGGFSKAYPVPAWQVAAVQRYPYSPVPYTRGVPDVAANASTLSGYEIVFGGKTLPVGGTSASTPLWAALIAQLNSHLGYKLGYVNPALYAISNDLCFHAILSGGNQYFPAGAGWNAATGLGTPDGTQLLSWFLESAKK